MNLIFFLSISLVQFNQPVSKSEFLELQSKLSEANHSQAAKDQNEKEVGESETESHLLRPYAEFEEAKYLLFDGETSFDSAAAKDLIAQNLPSGVKLIVLADSQDRVKELEEHYRKWLSPDQLIVHRVEGGAGFWSRDSLPLPIFSKTREEVALSGAKYYHYVEPDQDLSRYFKTELIEHDYFYEGGNFLANSFGDCFIVNNSSHSQIPDKIFKTNYGCKNLNRIPFLKGIGHIDERVKFLNSKIVVTDEDDYRKLFENFGYEVHMLPQASQYYETYVNSLLINGTIFMPVFDENESDSLAEKVYRDLGFKIIKLNSTNLSNFGRGSIHCITMTYPKMNESKLLKAI